MNSKLVGPAIMLATIGVLVGLESAVSQPVVEGVPKAAEYSFENELKEARRLVEKRAGRKRYGVSDERIFAEYIAERCHKPFWDYGVDGSGEAETYDDLPNICKRNRHLWDEGFPEPEEWKKKCAARGGYVGEDWGCYVP